MIDPDFSEEDGVWAKYHVAIVLGVLLLLAGGLAWWKLGASNTPAPQPQRMTIVSLPPPPKPVPTPPPVPAPPQPEQKLDDSKPRMDDAPKPDAAKPEPPKAPDEPPPSLGSSIKGDGADGFGLSGSGNGGRVGFGGNGRGGGKPYAQQASAIRSRVVEVLKADARTRNSAFELKVKLWLSSEGRVTRVDPANSGSPAASLVGVRVLERVPADLPMPVAMRIGGSRPK